MGRDERRAHVKMPAWEAIMGSDAIAREAEVQMGY